MVKNDISTGYGLLLLSMRKWIFQISLAVLLMTTINQLNAQCVMCTKTASSLDDKGARGLNNGIIYLAFMPLVIMGFIGYRWWQRNKDTV